MFTSPLDQCSKEPKMMSDNCKTRPESVIFSTYLINQQHVQIVSWQPWAWIAFIYTSQSSNGQPFSQLSFWKLCSKANKRRYKWIYATVILLKVVKDSVTDNAGSRTPSLGFNSFLSLLLHPHYLNFSWLYLQTTVNQQESPVKIIRSRIRLKISSIIIGLLALHILYVSHTFLIPQTVKQK